MASASATAPMFDTIQLPLGRPNIQLKQAPIAGDSPKFTKILCHNGEKVELGKKNDGSVKTVIDIASKISFTLVRKMHPVGGEYGYIQTKYLVAQAPAVVVSHLPLVAAAAADPSQLLQLNTPPFLINGDQDTAIQVMVHTSSPGAQLLNNDGTKRRVYYPNGSELRLVEGRVSGTETGQAGTATSTLLVQIDDDDNDDGWLPMGCLLRTTVRNEFDIDGFWTRALAESDQNVVSAGKVLGTVADARLAYGRGLGFEFGKYGKKYELFRNEYMPHILRPDDPIVPWVRREGMEGEGGNGGTRRRKCKKGKKSRASRASHSSRASRSSRRQLRRRRRSRRSRR